MDRIISVKPNSLLDMDPLALNNFLSNEIELHFPGEYNTEENISEFMNNMNRATAYICYFKEMETVAKITKRERKREGCSSEDFDRLLGCEEVFAVYKKMAEQIYEQSVKMITMKRLSLEEMKVTGTAV